VDSNKGQNLDKSSFKFSFGPIFYIKDDSSLSFKNDINETDPKNLKKNGFTFELEEDEEKIEEAENDDDDDDDDDDEIVEKNDDQGIMDFLGMMMKSDSKGLKRRKETIEPIFDPTLLLPKRQRFFKEEDPTGHEDEKKAMEDPKEKTKMVENHIIIDHGDEVADGSVKIVQNEDEAKLAGDSVKPEEQEMGEEQRQAENLIHEMQKHLQEDDATNYINCLKAVSLSNLDEQAMAPLSTSTISKIIFKTLFSELHSLEAAITRAKMTIVLYLASNLHSIAIQALFLPLLFSGFSLKSFHVEIFARSIKDAFTPQVTSELFCEILLIEAKFHDESSRSSMNEMHKHAIDYQPKPITWNENVIEVFLSLVGGQLTLEEKDWERFLKLLVAIANFFLDSKKFATLLFNIVSTKGIQIASQANEWKALVEKTNTFLKKPTLLALSKLNK